MSRTGSALILAIAAVTAFAALPAAAATLTASVTDKAGRPLPDAVVTLEPDGPKQPVKPMGSVEISQAKRVFDPEVTVVTVGTPVTFPNRDTVRHHVYSFSSAKSFELKLYAGTPSTPVVFDKPGIAVIGCNIHDKMTAWVVVVDTPLFARSGADGKAKLDGVAAGTYRLHAWHSSLPEGAAPALAAVKVGPADLEQAIRVDGAASLP